MQDLRYKTSTMIEERHEISWDLHEAPFSERFGDHFFSTDDGRKECQHVFLEGNRLPERWRSQGQFCIAELGFGTGLNFLETWRTWIETRSASGHLTFVSFEGFPMRTEELERAHERWPELSLQVSSLASAWPSLNGNSATWDMDRQTSLRVILAEASDGLAGWNGLADAWFLDGFSPARNPEMWSAEIADLVFRRTAMGGTFATYTSAGWVRRNLQEAGFEVIKSPGFGRKRHMLTGRKS